MKQKILTLIKHEAFIQLIKYGLVGGVGLIIDIGIYSLLVKGFNINYPFSNNLVHLFNNKYELATINAATSHIISSIVAIINNFILNRNFTFKVTDKKYKRFFIFFLIAIVGLVISTKLMVVLIERLTMNKIIAKIIATIVIAFIQFIVNKIITFKDKKS